MLISRQIEREIAVLAIACVLTNHFGTSILLTTWHIRYSIARLHSRENKTLIVNVRNGVHNVVRIHSLYLNVDHR